MRGASALCTTSAALVILNTAETPTLLDNLDTGLPAGTVLHGLFGIDDTPADLVVGIDGQLTLTLPPRSGQVWQVTTERTDPPQVAANITLAALPTQTATSNIAVQGTAPGITSVQLVVDGNLASAKTLPVTGDGRWQATISTDAMIDPAIEHRAVAFDPSTGTTSAAQCFRVDLDWQLLADIADPRGDDTGPDGRYRYPTDPSWGEHRQLDIRNVRVSGVGGALQIELRMHDVTATWSPANGFDHVAFTLFVQIPGRDGGSRVMPLQNVTLPDDMQWHYRLRAHGWTNAAFSSEGASATAEGTPGTPTAHIRTDIDADTIRFTLPAAALGNLQSLSGVKLYITTWDYDGGYRGLTRQAQSHTFGGGDGTVDPLVMDDTAVITVP